MSKTVEQYKKKPVIVEAVQYTEYGKLVKGMCNSVSCFNSGNNTPHVHTIHNQIVTLEVGDYILPEPDGEHFYPVKPDIFHSTYEPATTPSPDVAGSDAVDAREVKHGYWSYNDLHNLLQNVVNVLDLNDVAIEEHGPLGTEPHILVRKVLEQKDREINYLKSGLIAISDRPGEQHPQPAGASVEEAAHDYVEGMLGDYDPELQEEYDAILAHVLKGVELAGAAFQAAQVVGDGFNDKVIGKTIKDLPDAYTWDDLFEIGKGVPSGTQHFFRNYFDLPARKGAAPGIPDVRELVEKAETIVETYKVWNDEPRRLAEMLHGDIEDLQTTLAGIKRK